MSVTAIVVNFNAGQALRECVRALLASSVRVEVMVADNASTDGSAVELRALYGDSPGVEVLFNPTNLGFAAAVNACAKRAQTDWLLIINPDCMVSADTVAALRRAAENDPQAALAGPCVRDRHGRPERACLRSFPDPWNALMTFSGLWRLGRRVPLFRGVPAAPGALPGEVTRVQAVSGACMLVRRQALAEVGYMDEAYGLHCEDLDLMYRLARADWHCLFVPDAEAVHQQGLSSRSRPQWVHRHKHLGMLRFFRKHQAHGYPWPVRWLVYAGIFLHYLVLIPVVWLRR